MKLFTNYQYIYIRISIGLEYMAPDIKFLLTERHKLLTIFSKINLLIYKELAMWLHSYVATWKFS